MKEVLDEISALAENDLAHSYPQVDCRRRRLQQLFIWMTVVVVILLVSVLRWGAYLLISNDPLHPQADAAIVLQGSIVGERVRLGGAAGLLQQGITDRILVSIPRESYWGQAMPPIAYAYIKKMYGTDVAGHVDLCQSDDVDSTEEEARLLETCINQHAWHSVVIVTSDYHTRRAEKIWRRMLRRQHSSLLVQVHGVVDPEFHASGWWRDRRSAKIWALECTKLLWTLAGGN